MSMQEAGGGFHVMGVVLHPTKNEIVFVENTSYGGKPAGWGLPGGRSDGETDPVRRLSLEVREETGLSVKIFPDKIFTEKAMGDSGPYNRYLYLAVAFEEGCGEVSAVNNGVVETKGWHWFSLGNFPKNVYYKHRKIIEENMENIKSLMFYHGR